tara:strand:- start:9141 stop:9377 length:237 start_codon:yes stop_codon:yes gene_type:complete
MLERTNGAITYKTFQDKLQNMESNLKENIKIAEEMHKSFKAEMDEGDMREVAYLYVLEQNVLTARKAFTDFFKLPLMQ